MTDQHSDATETSRRQVLRTLSGGAVGAGALAAVGASRSADAETGIEDDDHDRCDYEYRCRGKMLQRRLCCNFGDYQCDPWEDTNITC